MDVVTDIIDLASACLASLAAGASEEVDQMVLDFADAFHTLGVHPDELPHQVFKLPGRGYGCYETVVFGGGGAPLTWGRGGALLGRSGQALFDDTEARIEIYVDDPWTGWRGTRARIRRLKTRLLCWWLILGPEISWAKVQHGSCVKWIGANIVVSSLRQVSLALPAAFAMDLHTEALELLELASAPLRRVRRLAGKAAWAGGFVPGVGSMISPLWAAVEDCKCASRKSASKIRKPQWEPTIPIVRIRHALRWIVAFTSGLRGALKRDVDVLQHKSRATLSMDFDASPWGYGGVLYWQAEPWYYFASAISQEDVDRFGIIIGDSAFQALVENVAILIGVRHWLPLWRDERLIVRIRSDSQAALGAWGKGRSSNPAVNTVVREMALDIAEGKYKIDLREHLPGHLNVLADALSRIAQPGSGAEVPLALRRARRVEPAVRDAAWWRAAGDPLASGSSS
jgi:hypothetical protein